MSIANERILQSLLSKGCLEDCAGFSSCGGDGALWSCNAPDAPGLSFTNDEFMRAFRYRLGLPQCHSGTTCRLKCVKDESLCGLSLDSTAVHCVSCRHGNGVLRMHAGVQNVLYDVFRAAGCFALKEIVVPHWASSCTACDVSVCTVKAWLDIVAYDNLGLTWYVNPLAQRYLMAGQSASVNGHAAEVAECEKQVRYPPIGSVRVTPAAAETFGRLGRELDDLLSILHSMAQQEDVARGRSVGNWRSRWICQIGAGIARNVAISIAQGTLAAVSGPTPPVSCCIIVFAVPAPCLPRCV